MTPVIKSLIYLKIIVLMILYEYHDYEEEAPIVSNEQIDQLDAIDVEDDTLVLNRLIRYWVEILKMIFGRPHMK